MPQLYVLLKPENTHGSAPTTRKTPAEGVLTELRSSYSVHVKSPLVQELFHLENQHGIKTRSLNGGANDFPLPERNRVLVIEFPPTHLDYVKSKLTDDRVQRIGLKPAELLPR